MSVRTDLVREHLVGTIVSAALERQDQALPEWAEVPVVTAMDTVSVSEHSGPAQALGSKLARLGYWCRAIEVERFEPARQPMPWLDAALEQDGQTELAARLARREPGERPDPESGVPSWRVPGPGGHVRHYAAIHAIRILGAESGRPIGISEGDLKRCWMLGFYLRCCHDATDDAPIS
jgi:hypothetical protein